MPSSVVSEYCSLYWVAYFHSFDLSSYRYNLIIFIYASIILIILIPLIYVFWFNLKSSYLTSTLLLLFLLIFPCLLNRSGALFLRRPIYYKTILRRCRVWFFFKFFEGTLDFVRFKLASAYSHIFQSHSTGNDLLKVKYYLAS
jgi:hypothetical protein